MAVGLLRPELTAGFGPYSRPLAILAIALRIGCVASGLWLFDAILAGR